MHRSSPWPKLLPPLGIALAVVLAATVALLWLGAGDRRAAEPQTARLMAEIQALRSDARRALEGDAAAFAALATASRTLEEVRSSVASSGGGVGRLASDDDTWRTITANLDTIVASRETVIDVHGARQRLAELAPELLAATANLVSSLSPGDLQANQPYLERFELNVEGMRQNLRSLASLSTTADAVQRLGDAEEYLGQIIRGLRGEDSSLGITPVTGEAARSNLDAATEQFEAARAAIAAVVAGGERFAAAEAALAQLDAAVSGLFERYRAAQAAATPGASGLLPDALLDSRTLLALVGTALVIVALMMFAYYRARDFRRAAEIQAEQNERNQQAILRLLDELSSLADGDLTVQATVTEDITGAIADSINYAIEALRDLVTTINDTSILVDAAAKQTEGTARQLLRSSETQAKQAVSASDSITRMASSIEEVSNNAERCSDVARHAVDVAHKGGEAVRRTIDGMNTIRETIQDTSKRIKRLGESSQEIGNIVELIEEIAEQTNILALNASIEASRAGEASRGFAVVADEVQKLAERSTNATKKIEVLVSTIQSDTNEAVVSMERSTTDVVGGALLAENAGAALDEIEQVSHQIASLVQNISSSSRSQADVSGAITKNMHVLREISSETSESTVATSDAISKLSELATQLRRSVAGFTLPDERTTAGVLSHARMAEGLRHVGAVRDDTLEAVAEVVEHRRHSG
jgi:twitching motility protein PilJ